MGNVPSAVTELLITLCYKEFFFKCSLCLTGYLPAGRQGISDFGSEGCRFPACRQTGNPAAVTQKSPREILGFLILINYNLYFSKNELTFLIEIGNTTLLFFKYKLFFLPISNLSILSVFTTME